METARPQSAKRYTLGEEIFNSVSHGVGGGLSIAGTVVLIVLAAIHSDAWGVVSSAIFGASLIILYTMSTLYHAITNPRAKAFFRIMDHNTIFFLIAGTYTPITLVPLRGALGWVLFGIVWGAAVLGIVFNSIDLEKFRKPSVVCYIAMGWVIVIAIKPMLQKSQPAFALVSADRRTFLHRRRYLLRQEKEEILPLDMASVHHRGQRFPLLCGGRHDSRRVI